MKINNLIILLFIFLKNICLASEIDLNQDLEIFKELSIDLTKISLKDKEDVLQYLFYQIDSLNCVEEIKNIEMILLYVDYNKSKDLHNEKSNKIKDLKKKFFEVKKQANELYENINNTFQDLINKIMLKSMKANFKININKLKMYFNYIKNFTP